MRFRPLELKLNFRLRQSGEQNEKQMTDNRQTTGGEEKDKEKERKSTNVLCDFALLN